MLQKITHRWQGGFGLETKYFRLWLVNIAAFVFIGVFASINKIELSTYFFSAVLMAANSLILFLLIKDFPKIKMAMTVFLIVFNAVLFGYYYFSSITIFF